MTAASGQVDGALTALSNLVEAAPKNAICFGTNASQTHAKPAPAPGQTTALTDALGMLTSPTSHKQMLERTDAQLWEVALKKETKQFEQLEVLSSGVTLKELRARGIYRAPIPMIILWSTSYDANNVFKRRKVRIVVPQTLFFCQLL